MAYATQEQAREAYERYLKANRERVAARRMIDHARKRAKERDVAFSEADMNVDSLTARLLDNPVCSCCRKPLKIGGGTRNGPQPQSPTLDRKVGSLGYVKGNVSVICWRCNKIKGDATLEELETIVDWMRKR